MKNMLEIRGRRGQLTLFVVLALVAVSLILLFYLWIKPTYIDGSSGGLTGFDGCVEESVLENVELLGKQGGYGSVGFGYAYNGDVLPYLCYTNLYHKQCVVQEPFLDESFASELQRLIKEDVENCYSNSINELKAKGYDVVSGGVDVSVELVPENVVVNIDAPTSVSSGGDSSERFVNFDVNVRSNIYEMLMIATSIIQYETEFGDSDVTTLMVYYPNYIIDKLKQSDGTTLYIIQDKETETKFQFASRSLAWPAGYGISG